MYGPLDRSLLPAPPSTVRHYVQQPVRRDSTFHDPIGAHSFQRNFAPASIGPSPVALPRDISSRFGFRLRELRRSRNLTQLQMAIDFGIDRSFISDVERGRKSISLTFLEVIALGLKVDLSELLRDL
jgi:DNA-binding XRE family transcriptional regulator